MTAVERAMGASFAAWGPTGGAASAHEASRLREAREHGERSQLLTAGLPAAAEDFSSFADHDIVLNYPAKEPKASIGQILDPHALARVIAAGIDVRLLDVRLSWDDAMNAPLGESLRNAAVAAEAFGAELGRWAQEVDLRSAAAEPQRPRAQPGTADF